MIVEQHNSPVMTIWALPPELLSSHFPFLSLIARNKWNGFQNLAAHLAKTTKIVSDAHIIMSAIKQTGSSSHDSGGCLMVIQPRNNTDSTNQNIAAIKVRVPSKPLPLSIVLWSIRKELNNMQICWPSLTSFDGSKHYHGNIKSKAKSYSSWPIYELDYWC